ncbi:hypothetical protein MBT84_29535 [Streptomyces sp. MBT84]|nr:hypothetical protein [Streptomyces sp. MBT84]
MSEPRPCRPGLIGFRACQLDASVGVPPPVRRGGAEAQLVTEVGECPGEVLVFAQGGYLSLPRRGRYGSFTNGARKARAPGVSRRYDTFVA